MLKKKKSSIAFYSYHVNQGNNKMVPDLPDTPIPSYSVFMQVLILQPGPDPHLGPNVSWREWRPAI